MGTTYKNTATVVNQWGLDLASLTLRHRRNNDPTMQEQQTWYNVSSGATTPGMTFTYETGAGTPYDYWWVIFVTTSGLTYSCKDNFYCSVSSDDDGKVTLTLDGASQEMRVAFSKSSGCTVGISQVD